jgi:hypothetical protein
LKGFISETMSLMHLWREILSEYVQLSNLPAAKNYVDGDMADVPKSLYRRYLEVSEATFQASLKNHAAGEIQHYKPIFNFHRLIKALRDVCHVFFATLR